MASSSGTASASSGTSTSAANPNDDRNKTVTGYPIQSTIVTGYPHIPQSPEGSGSRLVATFYTTTTDVYDSSRHQPPPPPPPPPTPLFFRMIYALCTTVLLMISGFLIFWLLLRPHFPEFQIASASIYTLNATTSPTSPFAVWNLSILVKNPNKKLAVAVDHLQVAVAYDNYLLSQGELRPFHQSKLNQTLVRAELAVIEANVGNSVVGEMLSWKARGSVEFGVRLIAWVRFRTGHWWFRSHFMVVYCPGLYLGFSANPNGTLLNPNKQCEVAM